MPILKRFWQSLRHRVTGWDGGWDAASVRPSGPAALPAPTPEPQPPPPRPLALALQGGGAHGAFTWGVLDRLLEEESFALVGLSGASAGAMNAAMLAQGWARGGRAGARAELDRFWERISAAGQLGPIRPGLSARLFARWGERIASDRWNVDHAFGSHLVEWARRWVSPYQTQGAETHPLRPLLTELVEPELIRASGLRLFISATSVRSGGLLLFDETQIGVDHLLASACLPHLFRAVSIDGVECWDGGYVANPPVVPLVAACAGADVAVVTINPLTAPTTPEQPTAIAARLNQITFNAPLLTELRGLIAQPDAPRLHLIEADTALRDLGVYSKLVTDWAFLCWLRETGRQTAELWLAANRDAVGQRATLRTAALS